MAVGANQNHPILPFETSFLHSARPHVFVAGGLSYLARNLIPALCKAGYGVKSMAMTSQQRSYLRSLGCASVYPGEPLSFEAVLAAASGCLYAVHCATAFVHYDTSPNELVAHANVLVTNNIIRACKRLRIRKLVVHSSEAVLYDGGPMCDLDETAPLPLHPVGSCASSLQQVERIVQSANSDSFETIIVRPRLLWGGTNEQLLPSLLVQAKSGKLRLIQQGQYLTSTCHVSNASEGIVCAIRSARGGDVFFLTDGKPILFADFIRRMLKSCKVRNIDELLSRNVPLWLARGVAKVAESLAFALGNPPVLTQSGVGLLGQEMTFDDGKARTEIGYVASVSLEDGMADIARRHLKTKVDERPATTQTVSA